MKRPLSRLLAALSLVAAVGLTSCAPEPTPGAPGTTSTTAAPTTTTTVPAPATNLIYNPSMELGVSPNIDGWRPGFHGQLTANPTPVTGDAHDGNRSAQVTVTNYVDGDAKIFFEQLISGAVITPGTAYTYTDWYKSTIKSELNFVFTKADGTIEYVLATELAPASSWTKATGTYTVPAGTVKMTVYHLIEGNGRLQIDDASLTAGASTGTPTTSTTTVTTTTVKPTTTTTVPSSTTTTTLPTGGKPFDQAIVSIEFDDNWMSGYTLGLPLVKSYGYTPINYVITDTVKNCTTGYMCAAQLKDWVAQGGEVGSHTVDHHSLVGTDPNNMVLTQAQVVAEMTNSKAYLTTLLGKAPTLMATPYCESNDFVTATAKTLYAGMRNCDDPFNTATNWDPYNIHSISVTNDTTITEINAILAQAKASNSWVVFTFHQVSTSHSGDKYTSSVGEITAILSAIKASGIKVLSTTQAFTKANAG